MNDDEMRMDHTCPATDQSEACSLRASPHLFECSHLEVSLTQINTYMSNVSASSLSTTHLSFTDRPHHGGWNTVGLRHVQVAQPAGVDGDFVKC